MSRFVNEDLQNEKQEILDEEWVELISEAFQMGITTEEIRAFLQGTMK